jgi:hypothetical protein
MKYPIYEVFETETGQEIKLTDADGKVWWIPNDPANADYQAYLASLNEPA